MEDNLEKILLLSCCAPCSCAVIKQMAQEGRDFAVYFYNPNIFPQEEWLKRKEENKKVCQTYNVAFIEENYDNHLWCEQIKGLENEPERGMRCDVCFAMRLEKTAQYALKNGFTAISSVLGVSRYKNLQRINQISQEISSKYNIKFIEIEGRKNGMQEKRFALIKELNLYSQTYCGCKFSMPTKSK